MPLTKDQIIEQLIELKIEHDPKARKEELLALLPTELTGDGTGEPLPPIEDGAGPHTAPVKTSGGGTVQLTRNAAGHQVGETFSSDDAKRLGILDHCRPLTSAT